MSLSRRLILCSVAVGAFSLAAQASPILNYYTSGTLGGPVLDGRSSESLANIQHAASYNGTLATQWELTGPVQATSTLLYSIPVGSLTSVAYLVDYTGGQFVLKAGGPWTGGGDGDYTVNLDHYRMLIQGWLDGSTLINSTATIEFSGDFAGYPGYRLQAGAASGAYVGQGALPAGFPSYLPAGQTLGEYGIVNNIRFEIVPEPVSVALLACGGLALLRRRRA